MSDIGEHFQFLLAIADCRATVNNVARLLGDVDDLQSHVWAGGRY